MRSLLLLLTCFSLHRAAAQGLNVRFQYFDKDWKPAPMKKGDYMQKISKVNDTTYLWTTYNMPGPMISQLRYRDEAAKTLHGICIYYKPDGSLDSLGEYRNGTIAGSWYFYDAQGNPFKRKDYADGRFVKDTLFTPPNQETIKKTLAAAGQAESTFEGGTKGWLAFLKDNMMYPPVALKEKTQGTVMVHFSIDEKGKLREPQIYRSVDYYLDEEALRLMRRSPLWSPATKDGHTVVSYKMQPVIFQL